MQLEKTQTYTEVEMQICNALSKIFGDEVVDIAQTFEGEFNQVYIVDLKDRKVVVKIFVSHDSPHPDKEPWVNALLQTHDVPHACLLYYSRNSTYFQHGLAVFEYIAGQNGRQAIASGSLTQEDFAQAQGKLLKRIHSVKLPQYGFEEGEDLLAFMVKPMLETAAKPFVSVHGLEQMINEGIAIVRDTMNTYAGRCSPVLTHGDCGTKNTIVSAAGHVLIDWDNCGGSIWLRDYAYLLLGLEMSGSNKEHQDRLKKAFFEGYGVPRDFSQEEIVEIVRALHIRQAVQLFPYHVWRNEMSKFEKVKALLRGLIQK